MQDSVRTFDDFGLKGNRDAARYIVPRPEAVLHFGDLSYMGILVEKLLSIIKGNSVCLIHSMDGGLTAITHNSGGQYFKVAWTAEEVRDQAHLEAAVRYAVTSSESEHFLIMYEVREGDFRFVVDPDIRADEDPGDIFNVALDDIPIELGIASKMRINLNEK